MKKVLIVLFFPSLLLGMKREAERLDEKTKFRKVFEASRAYYDTEQDCQQVFDLLRATDDEAEPEALAYKQQRERPKQFEHAVMHGTIDEVRQFLIEGGVDVCAIITRNTEVPATITLTLVNGPLGPMMANISVIQQTSYSLLWALFEDIDEDNDSFARNYTIAQMLIDAGARKNDLHEFLIYVANGGDLDFWLPKLLALGADINWIDSDGDTALMMAVASVDIDNVRLLLRAGADIVQRDRSGDSAIDIARQILAINPAAQPIVDLLQNALEGRNIE